MNLMDNYNKALQDIYDHVGFVEDWVVYPIDDKTDFYWSVSMDSRGGGSVKYAETLEDFMSDGDYCVDDISIQRFYKKWVWIGEKWTMIFCDPHIDGMKWFRIFDNDKCQNLDVIRNKKIESIIG